MEKFDEALSERLSAGALDIKELAQLFDELADYNQTCPTGEEVTMQLLALEAESVVRENLIFLEKSQLISIVGGYSTQGVLK